MTTSAFVIIWCDRPTCSARIETHRIRLGEARKDAAAQGWTHPGGLVDLCGPRESADKYTSYLDTWSGCAALTDHVPQVKAARKAHVHLTCSCGWEVPSLYSWEQQGVVARASALFRWQEHVRKAIEQAQQEAAS